MKIKWQYKILDKDSPSSSSYDGFFIKLSKGVAFLYEEQEFYESIRQLSFTVDGKFLSTIDHHVFENEMNETTIPDLLENTKDITDCFIFYMNGKEYVCPASPLFCIAPEDEAIIFDNPTINLKHIYKQNLVNPHHYEEDSFEFDDYVISHKGSFRYQCKSKSTGVLIWDKKVQGYLHTDMIRYGDGVLFGTAESGGKLYYVRLSDGTSIFEVETRGTAHFTINKGFCYCHKVGNKAVILKISLLDGNVETLQLDGWSCLDSPVRIIDDVLYTLTFDHLNDGKDANPTINAIQL